MKFKPQNSYLLFAVVGFALLVVGGFLFIKETTFVKDSIKTTGTIVSFQSYTSGSHKNTYYRPVVEFTDESNHKITFASGSSQKTSLGINQTVDVLYSKNNSQDAEIDNVMSLWGLPVGILIFGLIFFIVGAAITYKEYARQKIINDLILAGVKVKAKFLRTEKYSPNGQKRNSAYRMVLQFTENNQNYTFFSDHVSYNPASLIKTDLIDVYVDPHNYKNYYVDLSFLPDKYTPSLENSLNPNKPSRPLTWITVLWKTVNGMIFLYIASITYHNLKINGVNYGVYLTPIANLPAYLFIVLAFISHYLIQKQDEKAAINVSAVKSDLLKVSSELIDQNPVKTIQRYLWNSVKIIVKNAIIFFFLMIPIMMVFSIIQMILTGNGDITATY